MTSKCDYLLLFLSIIGSVSAFLDCKNRPDGVYALGCTQQVTRCRDGTSFKMFCDDNLYYDHKSGACVPKNLSDCLRSSHRLRKGPQKNDCDFKESGAYGYPNFHPCEREYFECNSTNGSIVTRKRCADDKYFEKESQRCEARLANRRCGENFGKRHKKLTNLNDLLPTWDLSMFPSSPDMIDARNKYDVENNRPFVDVFNTVVRDEIELEVHEHTRMEGYYYRLNYDPYCKKVAPGFHAFRSKDVNNKTKYLCSKYYWRCDNSTSWKRLTCPEDLVFDRNTSSCVDASTLSVCANGYQPKTYFQPRKVENTAYTYCRTPHQGILMDQNCATEYYVCGETEDTLYRCPHGLQFDIALMRCLYPAECKLAFDIYSIYERRLRGWRYEKRIKLTDYCDKWSAHRADTSNCPSIREELRLKLQAKFGLRNFTFPDDFAPVCDKVGPGYYGLKDVEEGSNYICSKYYWKCETRLSKPQQFICTEGLVFDMNKSRCVNTRSSPLCSAANKPRKFYAPIQLAEIKDKHCHSDQVKTEDGRLYSCTPEFIACGGGDKTFHMRCPNGLQYSPITQECLYTTECEFSARIKFVESGYRKNHLWV